MTLTQETREGVQVQDKLLHEFEFIQSTLRIFEREDGTYLFEWKKGLKRQQRPRIFDIIIGKFLCELNEDNEAENLARRIYKDWGKWKKAGLGERYKIEQEMKTPAKALLPYLVAGEGLRFERPKDVTEKIRKYRNSQDLKFPMLPQEKALLNSLSEF